MALSQMTSYWYILLLNKFWIFLPPSSGQLNGNPTATGPLGKARTAVLTGKTADDVIVLGKFVVDRSNGLECDTDEDDCIMLPVGAVFKTGANVVPFVVIVESVEFSDFVLLGTNVPFMPRTSVVVVVYSFVVVSVT